MFQSFIVIAVPPPPPNVSNDQFPIDFGCTGLGDPPALPCVGSHTRDSVLVQGEQLGFSLRVSAYTTGARETPGSAIPEVLRTALFDLPGPTGPNREGVEADFGAVVSSRLLLSFP